MDLFWDSLAKYKELVDSGYVNETWLADTYDMAQEALATGTAAMYPMPSWIFGDLQKKFPEKVADIGAFAIPFEGDNHAPAWAPFAFMMTNNSVDPELGRAVIDFVGSVEGQQAFFDAQPGIPACKGLDVALLPAQQDLYEIFSTTGRGGLVYQALIPTSGIPSFNTDYPSICSRVLTDTTTIEQEAARLSEAYIEAGKTQGIEGF
jgi:raffinose/stachyose/melibiose transport system substrate-binding protein